jgi:hypothetical protein
MASALEFVSFGTDSRICDDSGLIERNALCVGYDIQLNRIQVLRDTATCNKNDVGSLLWFSSVHISLV